MKTPIAGDFVPVRHWQQCQVSPLPGDPDATFQFSQHWLRGLLGGYLDGGTLPVTTDLAACAGHPASRTGKSCTMPSDCNAAANEICSSGRCLAHSRLPEAQRAFSWPVTRCRSPPRQTPSPAPPSSSKTAPIRKTRTADIMAVLPARPPTPTISPVCRLRYLTRKFTPAARALNPTPSSAPAVAPPRSGGTRRCAHDRRHGQANSCHLRPLPVPEEVAVTMPTPRSQFSMPVAV